MALGTAGLISLFFPSRGLDGTLQGTLGLAAHPGGGFPHAAGCMNLKPMGENWLERRVGRHYLSSGVNALSLGGHAHF